MLEATFQHRHVLKLVHCVVFLEGPQVQGHVLPSVIVEVLLAVLLQLIQLAGDIVPPYEANAQRLVL